MSNVPQEYINRGRYWWHSWNPIVGCSAYGPGCANCYAERLHTQRYKSKQAGKNVSGKCYEKLFGEIQLLEERLDIPLRRKIPTVYFVNSMSDLFHPGVPFGFIDKVFATIALCPQHTFSVLTKRADRQLEYWQTRSAIDESYRVDRMPQWYNVITNWLDEGNKGRLGRLWDKCEKAAEQTNYLQPLSNLWSGATICNQPEADKNIPLLLQTPAAHRFLSIEPMLEGINLGNISSTDGKSDLGWGGKHGGYPYLNCLTGREYSVLVGKNSDYKIDQVILGGETGKNARPMHPDWAKSVRDQCKTAGAPFFLKQIGNKKFGRELDGVEHNDLAWRQ